MECGCQARHHPVLSLEECFRTANAGDLSIRMDSPQQVTFCFGTDMEIHYLDRLPSVGDRVAHARELWVVTNVDEDAVGVLVFCEHPSQDAPGDELG
jgi:hypothetical protein